MTGNLAFLLIMIYKLLSSVSIYNSDMRNVSIFKAEEIVKSAFQIHKGRKFDRSFFH